MNRKLDVLFQKENGSLYSMPNKQPDWIKLPNQFGGKKKKVISVYDIDECYCRKHPTTIYELEDNYIACKCDVNGFIFAKG